MSGGWVEMPVSDDAPVLLHKGEFVIRVGSNPIDLEALSRLVGDPLKDDE